MLLWLRENAILIFAKSPNIDQLSLVEIGHAGRWVNTLTSGLILEQRVQLSNPIALDFILSGLRLVLDHAHNNLVVSLQVVVDILAIAIFILFLDDIRLTFLLLSCQGVVGLLYYHCHVHAVNALWLRCILALMHTIRHNERVLLASLLRVHLNLLLI